MTIEALAAVSVGALVLLWIMAPQRPPLPALRPLRRHLGAALARADAARHGSELPYVITADLGGLGGFAGCTFPVFQNLGNGERAHRTTYWTDVAGLRVQSGNLPALQAAVAERVLEFVRQQRLPRFWFYAAGRAFPVYARGRWYETSVGPHRDAGAPSLAVLRERLRWWCVALQWDISGEIAVAAVGPDLRRLDPCATLAAPGMWFPVFNIGGVLRVEDADLPDHAAYSAPSDLLRLRNDLATMLAGRGDRRACQLQVTSVSSEMWPDVLARLAPADRHLTYVPAHNGQHRAALPLFRIEGQWVCAGPEPDRSLHFSDDAWELADRVGSALVHRGAAQRRDNVRIEQVAELGR